jgi:hypothetical protein
LKLEPSKMAPADRQATGLFGRTSKAPDLNAEVSTLRRK